MNSSIVRFIISNLVVINQMVNVFPICQFCILALKIELRFCVFQINHNDSLAVTCMWSGGTDKSGMPAPQKSGQKV